MNNPIDRLKEEYDSVDVPAKVFTKEEIESVKYDLVNKLYYLLNDLKGLNVSMRSPREGVIKVEFEGYNFNLLTELAPAEGFKPMNEDKFINDKELRVRYSLYTYVTKHLDNIKSIKVSFENPNRGFFWIDFKEVKFVLTLI